VTEWDTEASIETDPPSLKPWRGLMRENIKFKVR
jgi:hypothetical protein